MPGGHSLEVMMGGRRLILHTSWAPVARAPDVRAARSQLPLLRCAQQQAFCCLSVTLTLAAVHLMRQISAS